MSATMQNEDRRHILVVEDNALVSAMIRDALEYAGFEVTAVEAAEDALGLAVMDVTFDLLFTDIELAGPIDGWELAEAMREMHADIPVVYASARAANRGPAGRVPNSVFVSKPYSPVALCAMIREMLTPSNCTPDIAPAPREVIRLDERRALRA
jgi:CheY-like chemotaxis protein